jgi:non-specific serine/threonine protein kinase/serine/threonine-protein kinase
MPAEEDSPPSPSQQSTGAAPSSAPIGALGPYRVLQRIGEGGMGEVFLAEQTEPVRRRVAIKFIGAGLADRQIVARFEAERQALAMMNHPSIAKVFDAGQTPAGVPYFVMEYIPGMRITEHCDRNHLTTRERVALFIKVCEAVQHAHQKSILHRDLKPSNVLVVEQDGAAVPKIIDFGLAKALGHRLTDRTMFTQIGALVGTPDYMSPEQAETSGQDVDTRTDVYSLGVMLYELLTGVLPFDSKQLRLLSYTEMIRRIREVEPPRPTARLGSLGGDAAAVAQARKTDAAALRRDLAGDLDWVVMKALEKDRARRYGSPAELAADLGRFLRDEPVVAGPPSAMYRARKFTRRHRFGVAAAVTGVLLLAGFGVAMTVQAGRIARERDRANGEARRAQRVSGFLEDLFLSIDPGRAKGKEVTVREVLDRGRERLREDLADEPGVQVSMLKTLGAVYRNLGDYGPARELLEEAVKQARTRYGPDARPTLEALKQFGRLLYEEGKDDEARTVLVDALARSRRALGNDDPQTLQFLNDLGNSYIGLGRWEEAEAVLEEAVTSRKRVSGPEDPATLIAMNNLANVYRSQGRYQEAEALCRETLEIQRRIIGSDHLDTVYTAHNLATVLYMMGRYSEAETIHRQNFEIRRRILGDEHHDTLKSLRGIGLAVGFAGRHAEAERLHRQILEIQRRTLGPDARATIGSLEAVAIEIESQGRHQEAAEMLTQVLDANTRTLGPDHPTTLQNTLNLASTLIHTERRPEAERMTRDALERSRRALGRTDPMTRFALYNLGAFEALKGGKSEALRLLREAREAGDSLSTLPDDQDFTSLHGDPDFEAIVRSIRDEAAKRP